MEALALIPPGEALDGIVMEIAHLANRVGISDQLDMSDPNHLSAAVYKVRAVLSMGLETLVMDDAGAAQEILRRKWLLHIFQLGYGRSIKLARRAHRLDSAGWLKRAPAIKSLLGTPLLQILDGLHRSRPLFYAGGTEPYRFFESLDEINAANEALDRIEYLGELFIVSRKLLDPNPDSWSWKRIYPVEINFETVLRTALTNAAAGRGFEFKPLRKSDLKIFIETAMEEISDSDPLKPKRRMRRDVRENLIAYLDSQDAAKNDKERKILDEMVGSAIKFLEEEFSRLNPDSFEPKYIQGLIIRK